MKTFRMRTMVLLALLAVAAIIGLNRIARRAVAPARPVAKSFSREGIVYQRLNPASAPESSHNSAAAGARANH